MLRRLLAGMALTGAALIPAMSAIPAHAATPARAAHFAISARLCVLGGGQVFRSHQSPTGLICIGGRFHRFPVRWDDWDQS